MASGVVASFPLNSLPDSLNPLSSAPTDSGKASTLPPEFVIDPNLLPTEMDLFRFEAEASKQLAIPADSTTASPGLSTFLASSPYNSPSHHLDLRRLAAPSLLLAKALTVLQPTRPDYATAPYTTALNWPDVVRTLRALCAAHAQPWTEDRGFYVVVFRSRLKTTADAELLYELDAKSHEEATASGGLLKYWFGKVDGERRNLATCVWHSREDARNGGTGPWHKKARGAGGKLYEKIEFSTLRLTILEGAEDFRIEDWTD